MKDQFVPYELAVKLKELGFNDPCFGYYNRHKQLRHQGQIEALGGMDVEEMSNTFLHSKYCSAPLWQQASQWILNNYGLNQNIYKKKSGEWVWSIYYTENCIMKEYRYDGNNFMLTYEESRKSCFEKLIDLTQVV